MFYFLLKNSFGDAWVFGISVDTCFGGNFGGGGGTGGGVQGKDIEVTLDECLMNGEIDPLVCSLKV